MKTLILCSLFVAGYAAAQCLVPIPPSAPRAETVTIKLNPDGGNLKLSDGAPASCLMYANGSGVSSSTLGVAIGKCNVARSMGDQALANDNGYNDGGTP